MTIRALLAAAWARFVALRPAWRAGASIAAAVVVLVGVGECSRWYGIGGGDPLAITVAPAGGVLPRRPIVLEPTKIAAKVERAADPVPVRPLAPTPRQEKRLEGALRLDLDGEALLGVWEAPPAPAGGEVAVVAPLDGGGPPRAVYVPRPRRFFELGGPFEVGAGVVAGTEGYGGTLHVGKDLARAGRFTLRLEADADVLPGGVQGRVAALAVVRF